MIDRLTLKNFQKHGSLSVEFDPKITVITGETDAGKSTVIRALALVCLSEWDPCFVRHGKKSVKVTLDVDGQVVFRHKGKGENLFSIDGKKFAAFAHSVPPEIDRCVNVGEENFQFQLDSHFWFSDTSGQVSKKLNRIVNLDDIDRTLANVAQEVRKTKTELSVYQERRDEARKKLDELSWVPEFVADFERLEAAKKRSRELTHRIALAARTLAPARSLKRRAETSLMLSNALRRLVRLCATRDAARDARGRLEGLITEAVKARESADRPLPDSTRLIELRTKGDKSAERRRNLEMLVEELTEAKEKVCRTQDRVLSLTQDVQKSGRSRKLCPYCGTILKRSTPSSSPTCTSPTRHLSAGLKRKTGMTSSSRPSHSPDSSATPSNVPW